MNILFFSMWYFPEPVMKPHSLAKELKSLGHNITVITGFPNYPHGNLYSSYKNAPLIKIEHIDNIKVIRVRCWTDRSTNAFRRIMAMLSYSILAYIVAVFSGEKFDAVWTYQIGLPGSLFTCSGRIPHLHEVQDLWPAWGEGVVRGVGKLSLSILTNFQRCIYLQASAISTISIGFSHAITSIYRIPRSKVRVISNWADVTLFDRSKHIGKSREEFGLRDGFLLTYGGNIGTAQGLKALVEAAAELSGRGCIIVIAGDGVEKPFLKSLAKKLKATNVSFIDRLPPNKMGDLLSVSDALFIGLASDAKYKITIPSKTYACLAAGKPILAAASGDLADFINSTKTGVTCSPEDPKQIAAAILSLMNVSSIERNKVGERAYKTAMNLYNGNSIAREYQDLFVSLVHA